MITPDVENAVTAQKIEIRLVIHVVEVRALCPRIDLVEPNHALRSHERAVHMPFVKLIILTQSRGDNFLYIQRHRAIFRDLPLKRKWVGTLRRGGRADKWQHDVPTFTAA